jgi:hypothetical protein
MIPAGYLFSIPLRSQDAPRPNPLLHKPENGKEKKKGKGSLPDLAGESLLPERDELARHLGADDMQQPPGIGCFEAYSSQGVCAAFLEVLQFSH